jgi:SagB-type dehydrogenase family enzyme
MTGEETPSKEWVMANQDLDVALTYHAETKHSYDSVYRQHHILDWDNQPRPYKLYTELERIALPEPVPETPQPALLTLIRPALGGDAARLPTLEDLAYVLFNAAGVSRRRVLPGYGEMLFRAAACTGALYHIELYVVTAELPGLAAGVYHFGPVDFALRRLRQGDYRQHLIDASGQAPGLTRAPVILIATDTFWRNAWKYRARAYRHSFWDTGTILANLLAAATARTLPAHVVAGFTDASVNALLALEAPREVSLVLVGLGESGSLPPPAPPMAALTPAVVPPSSQEVEYPAIYIMHAASALDSPEEVALWRGVAPPLSLPAAEGAVFPLCPSPHAQLPSAPLEQVIRRRGSSRTFQHRPLSMTQLSNVLMPATQTIPADFLEAPSTGLNELYLLVHAVSEIPAGAYFFRAQEQTLELLVAGDFRAQAGDLDLGQDLAADASVNVYFLCDLSLILERYGNRGYRAAQLEAAILAGRMYLAAYAQGFGATGLTFFDDDVIDFFSPHAADKSVMFLIALGYAGRHHR